MSIRWKPSWGRITASTDLGIESHEWGVVPREVFEALLAVAKEADHREDADMSQGKVCWRSVIILDAVWPDWRSHL